MNTTINTTFDPHALPAWAQRIPEVVELCKANYAFRCDVCAAKSPAMRKLLTRQATGPAGDPMKTQLSTTVSPETRQAYTRLAESTGVSLTDILTTAVPLLEQHYRQAETVVGYVQLNRWGDVSRGSICPECDRPFDSLPWIAIRANGTTCAPVCYRCASSD